MEFRFGRDNLALTVFVPYDCQNSCAFCTSKKAYAHNPPSFEAVEQAMRKALAKSEIPLREVVFTGGEPMADVCKLCELVDLVPDGLDVYINTTFTNHNLSDFVSLVNENEKIKGVNISRHATNLAREAMADLAPDEAVRLLQKPVRINCVWGLQDVAAVLKRWEGYDVEISFRRDYTEPLTVAQLHSPYDPLPLELINMGFAFDGHSRCRVCDTTCFARGNQRVRYHKGFEQTALHGEDFLEINDLIITQDGKIRYDWKACDEMYLAQFLVRYFVKSKLVANEIPWMLQPFAVAINDCAGVSPGGCGGSCGGVRC